jgi:two-component system, LuxR family, sensor kinase FixL
MTRLDSYLVYAESHRATVCAIAGVMILLTAWADWILPNTSVGFLYLIPVLLAAPALSGYQILIMALLCAYLREAFDPLQSAGIAGSPAPMVANPANWAVGSFGRFTVAACGFAMTGFFVRELNQRRQLLMEHLAERERQMLRQQETELQVRMLIETSPLAILTLNAEGKVLLANESARQLLAFDREPLQGEDVEAYLPILPRMLHSHRSGNNIRTNVECKGHRRGGEVFLAHVWLSTYRTSEGPGLAAVVWDASENLRDREGAGLDSMMATSRVLIGAISHEIRNLASAALSAYAALPVLSSPEAIERNQALGSLLQGLEKIASSGLRMASSREAVVADLGTVLDETRIVIEPSLREAGIAVVWETASGLPLVQADHHGLLQVFLNLARNSARALEQCPVRQMRVSAEVERDLVVVRFRDTGQGVANPEELFKPFQPGAQSVGLGLYISRAIVRSHGGGLRYEHEDAGSCFAVELWPAENSVEERWDRKLN